MYVHITGLLLINKKKHKSHFKSIEIKYYNFIRIKSQEYKLPQKINFPVTINTKTIEKLLTSPSQNIEKQMLALFIFVIYRKDV